jgi:hypothetical protein
MENTLKQIEPISPREIAYYRRRNQTRQHAEIATFFADEAEAGRISRKEIAQRLGKDPAQITRWLSSPTNLESDTTSDLLLAMGAEMDYRVVRFVDRPTANYSHPVHAKLTAAGTNSSYRVTFVPEPRIERAHSFQRVQVEAKMQPPAVTATFSPFFEVTADVPL